MLDTECLTSTKVRYNKFRMYLKSLELSGFKSFGKKETLDFNVPISAIVGPNGSGKSNIAEAFRFVLGEQSIKSMRGKKGEDLIWGGGKNTARSNRASVKVVFDNTKKLFDLDFEEVSIERTVHRDGVNQYAINNSNVRLRDIVELLASANIGSSGHHIISQGEADRILNTSPKERREMIEDALGLKVFQYKLTESKKKLGKTRKNIEQVESLRKEIAPHMRFLKKQVEKVEKTQLLREDLKKLYEEYLKRESTYIEWWQSYVENGRKVPQKQLEDLEIKLKTAKEILENEHKNDEKSREIINLEAELRSLREKKDTLARDLGRLEGELRAEERVRERTHRVGSTGVGEQMIPLSSIKEITRTVFEYVEKSETEENIGELKRIMRTIRDTLNSFVVEKEQVLPSLGEKEGTTSELESLQKEQEEKQRTFDTLEQNEKKLRDEYSTLKKEIESVRDEGREAERNMFAIMTEQNDLRAVLNDLQNLERKIALENEQFHRELEEGAVLIGRSILSFDGYRIVASFGEESSEELSVENIAKEDRELQVKRRRDIEKIKIRLEEFGSGGGEDILKEYNEVSERDMFLERETEDLLKSAESLKGIMKELEEKLHTQFKEGILKINIEFQNFFSLMFGGGRAELKALRAPRRKTSSDLLLAEEEGDMEEMQEVEEEEGIDITISLPRKRIKGLVMLSGGERALTSIALLFAMSQVNPPPFLILDETDAALDEANSKRYSDMIENLSKYSQLIVITHNRETMSRAHILYGVTMGSEGLSKLLSIKFDEAVQVAK